MVTDGKGHLLDVLSLPDSATKGNSGRTILLHRQLHAALAFLMKEHPPQPSDPIMRSARKRPMTAARVVNWFWDLYRRLGFNGCSTVFQLSTKTFEKSRIVQNLWFWSESVTRCVWNLSWVFPVKTP